MVSKVNKLLIIAVCFCCLVLAFHSPIVCEANQTSTIHVELMEQSKTIVSEETVNYPKTGELFSYFSSFFGTFLLLWFLLFCMKRRKSDEK